MYYYSICISRMNLETLEDKNPITLDEWLKMIEYDNELIPINIIEGRNPRTKEIIYIEVNDHATWKNDKESNDVKFFYENGKICTLYYDELVVDKMRQMADMLNGKVILC